MNPIKVVYHYSSTRMDTGSPRALLQMVDSLDRSRFIPAFMAEGEGPLVDEMREKEVEIIPGIVNSVSWRHPWKSLANVKDKAKLLSRVGAGILHLNEPGWNSDAVLAARMANIPVALHLHNPCRITRSNLNFSIASKVFICSSAQRNVIENFDLIRDKHVVLHNAVNLDAFASGRPTREAIGLAADNIVIGTVAQIIHRKGIDIFLDAATQLLSLNDKLKFVIVGPSAANEKEYFDNMMARVQSTPLKGHVIYLGSRADIPDMIASFDIFCLPTRAETFGMVVIEAMAVGVPVVASAVGGIPEIITDRTLGYSINSLTADAYVAALAELISQGEGRKVMGELGRSSLTGRFDLDHMGKALTDVYQEMLA